MGFKLFGGAACALVLSAAAVTAMPVNLLKNGSFEDTINSDPTGVGLVQGVSLATIKANTTGQWDVFRKLNGWASGAASTPPTDSGIEVQNSRLDPIPGPRDVDAYDGVLYIELDSDDDYNGIDGSSLATTNSEARQRVSLQKDRTYTFSFAYSPRTEGSGTGGITSSGILFNIGSLITGSINVPSGFVVNGALPNPSFMPSATTIGTWSVATLMFKPADDVTTNIVFKATGKDNEHGGFIDAVSLSVAPVPLPAGLVLALTGLGIVAAVRRRKTAAA